MAEETKPLKVGDTFIMPGCPTCSGTVTKYNHCQNVNGIYQIQLATCADCGAMWMDSYQYQHSRLLKEGELK